MRIRGLRPILPVWYFAVPVALLLNACVHSDEALFLEEGAITDRALIGTYVESKQHDQPGKESKKHVYEVFLKGSKYLILEDKKLALTGNAWDIGNEFRLAQLRSTGERETRFYYMLFRSDAADVKALFIGCESWYECRVTSADELMRMVEKAKSTFDASATKLLRR